MNIAGWGSWGLLRWHSLNPRAWLVSTGRFKAIDRIRQAAIAALHAEAKSHIATDWARIAGLYTLLLRINPSPVIELNRAVAIAMYDGS